MIEFKGIALFESVHFWFYKSEKIKRLKNVLFKLVGCFLIFLMRTYILRSLDPDYKFIFCLFLFIFLMMSMIIFFYMDKLL